MKMTTFAEACKTGDLQVVRYLVSQGADVKAVKLATISGHLEVVKYLVSQGADNEPVIPFASNYGHLEVVKYLVSQGADVRANDNAVRMASYNGHLEVSRSFNNLYFTKSYYLFVKRWKKKIVSEHNRKST